MLCLSVTFTFFYFKTTKFMIYLAKLCKMYQSKREVEKKTCFHHRLDILKLLLVKRGALHEYLKSYSHLEVVFFSK